ncbi:MAG: carbohydrate porin [Polyangiaceae bacterium]|jgi:high affinity Mn2+ porin
MSVAARPVAACLVACILFASVRARAQAAPPAAHEDAALDAMNVLARNGLHDIKDETWNVYGQFTYISSWHPSFAAPYTNANGSVNSLLPDAERGYTGSATLFFGLRLWPGGEGYFVPEFIAEVPFSQLRGIGGAIENFELQKTGSPTGQLYRSRTYVRHTIEFGGARIEKTSDPMQLATTVDSRRLVLTAGNFTVLDFFDRNTVTWDPRQTFLNMAFMTHASWDFPADQRGYSYGGAMEIYWDEWALRLGRMLPPQEPNSQPMNFRFWEFYGDQLELEHDHVLLGQPGAVRLLGYRNRVYSGRFADAIAAFEADPADNAAACGSLYNFTSTNAAAPDLCWVRKPNVKVGIGVNLEQHITDDIGVFFRGMYSDGQSEVDAFNSADRSLSFGSVGKGSAWHRPFDVTGVGFAMSWISQVHAQYLAMGGVDNFIGDGHLNQAAEGVVDVFYSLNLFKAIWLSADYQYLWNPGFNADRGPVNIFGVRIHGEF